MDYRHLCVPWTNTPNTQTAILTANQQFDWQPVPNDPQPLTITVVKELTTPTIYHITFSNGESITFDVIANGNISFLNVPPYVSPSVQTSRTQTGTNKPLILSIVFKSDPTALSQSYDNNDEYILTIDMNCSRRGPAQLGVSALLKRTLGVTTSTVSNGPVTGAGGGFADNIDIINNDCDCVSDNVFVRVPIIDILGQTTAGTGEFLSDFTFTIKDQYKYDKHNQYNKNGDKCDITYMDPCQLKTTSFFEFGPPLQKVVKGKGKTLRDKLVYYNTKHHIEPSFQVFYEKIILYGMLKYILARLLYGDFNIDYLYRKYNKKFFKDLAKSRFCGFIEFFEDPTNGIIGYDQYFEYGC